MQYKKTIDLLGKKAKDKISNTTGVITSICFDLYGCIQVLMTLPKSKDSGDVKTFGWIDINRLIILKGKKVMECIDFEKRYNTLNEINGCANKPIK